MTVSPAPEPGNNGDRHRRPIIPGRKGQEHLLLAISYLIDTVSLTNPNLTHPVHRQCLKSALALAKEANLLLAPVLHKLQPFPPPPPRTIAGPRLPTEENPT